MSCQGELGMRGEGRQEGGGSSGGRSPHLTSWSDTQAMCLCVHVYMDGKGEVKYAKCSFLVETEDREEEGHVQACVKPRDCNTKALVFTT